MSRRLLVGVLVVVVAAVGCAGWWYWVTRPAYRLARGQEAVARGDWDAADLLVDQLEASGDSDRSALLRGESLFAQKRYAEAVAAFNRVRDRGEIRRRAALYSGRALLAMNEWAEASRLFAFVLDEEPDQLDALRGLAAVQYDLGNLDQARQHLRRVVEIAPRDGRAHRLIGLISKDMTEVDVACQAYRDALAADLPDSFRRAVPGELAECLVRQTEFKQALEVLDEARAAGIAEDGARQALRAECLWRLGRAGDALALLDPALRDHPTQAELWLIRGRVHLDRQEFAQALADMEKAAALKPRDYDTQYQLARAYAAAGRPDDARRQQQVADGLRKTLDELTRLSKDAMNKPLDAAIRLQLARLCEQIDRPELAAMWYRAAEQCRRGRAVPPP
ncbi:MAG: tetratricopeptide repeat protein [Gemmataceae bacterium]